MNYIDHSLTLISTITRDVSISAFAYMVGIPIGITNSAIGLKTCVVTARIKKYKSIKKKKKRKHGKVVLLRKFKLNSIKVLIYKALIDSNTNHNQFVLVNIVMKNFYDRKEEIKHSNNK